MGPSLARILSDQRAHQTSGDFAVAFKSEDGTAYSEKATALDGTRRGQYSYVDDLGQTQNVKWEAGPGGFKVLGANNQPAHPQQTPAFKAAADNLARLDALKPKPAPEPIYKSAPRPVYQQQQIQQEYTQPAPQPQWQPAPKPVEQYEPVPQWQPAPKPVEQYKPVQQFIEPATTPAPRRFFPPGQLAFKRDQLGYSYQFSS